MLESLKHLRIDDIKTSRHEDATPDDYRDLAVQLLQHLAAQTWQRLEASLACGVSQGEETITDNNLLDIKASGLPNIRIWKCPKHLERNAGVDWDWLIGSYDDGWFRFAVQAKKLNLETHRYDSLRHRVRDVPQIDILDEYAHRYGAIPAYCLYNYVSYETCASFWRCCSFTLADHQLGCSLTPLRIVRQSLQHRGDRTFEFIHRQPATIPWRCLALCPNMEGFLRKHYDNVHLHKTIPNSIQHLLDMRSDEGQMSNLEEVFPHDLIPKRLMIVNLNRVERDRVEDSPDDLYQLPR